MKKVFFLTIFGASLLFASCNNVYDSKIDAYEKACKSGDLQEIARIEAEIEEVIDDLSEKQLKRYENLSLAQTKKELFHEMNKLKNTVDEYKELRNSYESNW